MKKLLLSRRSQLLVGLARRVTIAPFDSFVDSLGAGPLVPSPVAKQLSASNSNIVPDAWLEPSIVIEVLADEITPGPRHTAAMSGHRPGFAMRSPRIVSLRDADKKPEDATSVREIREMFEQQQQPGRGRGR